MVQLENKFQISYPELIIANRIRTPDGTILQSFHRHDYKEHWDENGLYYAVDGGTTYLKRVGPTDPGISYEEMSVHWGASHEEIRAAFAWGSYGKDGNQPIHFIFLKDMEDDHISAILRTQTLHVVIAQIFLNEQKYRVDQINSF